MKKLYTVMCNSRSDSWPTGDLPGGNTFDSEDVANDHASALNSRGGIGVSYDVVEVWYEETAVVARPRPTPVIEGVRANGSTYWTAYTWPAWTVETAMEDYGELFNEGDSFRYHPGTEPIKETKLV